MLAWHCHEGWNPVAATNWLKKVHPGDYRKPPMLALVATNGHLNRLAQIANFVEKHSGGVEFYYPEVESFATWHRVLTPERLFSRVIALRYRQRIEDDWSMGVLYFDPGSPSHSRFMMKYLRAVGFQATSAIAVFVPCALNGIEAYQSEVDSYLSEPAAGPSEAGFGSSSPIVTVRQLSHVEFMS